MLLHRQILQHLGAKHMKKSPNSSGILARNIDRPLAPKIKRIAPNKKKTLGAKLPFSMTPIWIMIEHAAAEAGSIFTSYDLWKWVSDLPEYKIHSIFKRKLSPRLLSQWHLSPFDRSQPSVNVKPKHYNDKFILGPGPSRSGASFGCSWPFLKISD